MATRMDRYENLETSEKEKTASRVRKNDSLYNQIKTTDLSRVRTSSNIKVIENSGKTIDLEKVRKYIEENKNKPAVKRRVISVEESKDKEDEKKLEETKEYDILSVLEKAKKNREIDYEKERYKRLKDTQYDILSKIKMYEEEETKEEEDQDLNTEERTLVNLINTITIHKGEEDLLGELMGSKTEEITLPIEKEVEKGSMKEDIVTDVKEESNEIIEEESVLEKKQDELEKTRELVELKEKATELDKSFFTNSMTFSKEDFEGFEELEKSVKKNSVFTKIMLVILILIIIASLVIIANYVFKLGLF